MKRNFFFVALMLSLSLFSCNQDDDLLRDKSDETVNYDVITGKDEFKSDDSEGASTLNVLKFTYKGKTYISDCIFGEDFQIKDDSIKRIFDELNNIPNVAIEIKSDLSVEFYDSKEELDYASKLRREFPLTRAEFAPDGTYIRNYELRLWDRAKGRTKGGPYTHFYSNGIQGNQSPAPLSINEAYLTKIGFNNNISSCQMWGEVHMTTLMGCQPGQYKQVAVTFYDGNFTGKSLNLPDIDVNRTYTYRDYFSGFKFNDLTSSFVVTYY
ncbi:hypothetical protein AAE250_01100 [Bacteroides sp. GD17]|jgi:hypothetical protein|uniref:hypothetical protein n=1 Tax=Bacteroides sp. GD17 TaxID=3139826 RepID=UPI0025D8CE61|nr:hypothetical protein [uncultured Bacteroides sp.]